METISEKWFQRDPDVNREDLTYSTYGFFKTDLENTFALLGYDFDGGTIYAAINSAFERRILKFMDTLHCFYFGYLGEAFAVSDETKTNQRMLLRAPEIEKSLFSAKISFGLEKVSITAVTLIKNLLITKEKMKKIYKNGSNGLTWRSSLGDDLEKQLRMFRNNYFSSKTLISNGLFFMPMLTPKEKRSLKNNDEEFLKSFSLQNPDVPVEQMVNSNSKSKFAYWDGYRITIPDLDYQITPQISPLEFNLNFFPISEKDFSWTVNFSPIDEFSPASEIYLEELLRILLDFYNAEFADEFNFVEIYSTLKVIKQIEVVTSNDESDTVLITDRYLAECFWTASVPETYSLADSTIYYRGEQYMILLLPDNLRINLNHF